MPDLDPLEAIDIEGYKDPTPEEITDPTHPDYVLPAASISPLVGG